MEAWVRVIDAITVYTQKQDIKNWDDTYLLFLGSKNMKHFPIKILNSTYKSASQKIKMEKIIFFCNEIL